MDRRWCSSTGSASRASSGTGSLRRSTATRSSASTSAAPAARANSSGGSSRSSGGRPTSERARQPRARATGRGGALARGGDRAQARARAPRPCRCLVLMGGEADLTNLAPRMLASAERIESVGLETWVGSSGRRTRRSRSRRSGGTARSSTSTGTSCWRTIPADYVRQCRAIAAAERLSGRLGEVGHPVLVVVGGLDDRTLPEHGRELARALPNGRSSSCRKPGTDPARGARGDRRGDH